MNKFASGFSRQANTTLTENGAETYRSTLNSVLDFFYMAPARQDQDNTELFQIAFEQDSALALKALFYIRDCRGGKGQRRTMRDVLGYLSKYDRKTFNAIVGWVPMFGYWKDILPFVRMKSVVDIVSNQLNEDLDQDKRPTLLAKWMPSINTSSSETVKLAQEWARALHMTPVQYRKMLSVLRARIGIVESLMSANEWENIEYSHVPSRAFRLYRKAFEKHDENRFHEFVTAAIKGEEKVNASQVYPHEIVKYFLDNTGNDLAMEAMWVNLPNYFDSTERKILPLIDVSSSMSVNGVMHISIALGMYCAERNTGPFQNMFLTFSNNPEFVKISGNSLRTRVNSVKRSPWGGNTDLLKAFREILKMAIENGVPQEDMPTHFFIFSDMEFDAPHISGKNFDAIRYEYESYEYDMPMLVFWNLNSRRDQAPVTKNTDNAFLVSGFSPEAVGKILNSESYTPMGLMLETLNSDRYAFIDEIVDKH